MPSSPLSPWPLVPAAARADFTVATVERPTPISAYAGHVIWSQYDAGIAGFRLFEAHASPAGQVTTQLAAAPRSVPFDADIGPGADGAPTVVYSRCATEPRLGADQLPIWATGRGCDVYALPLGATTRDPRRRRQHRRRLRVPAEHLARQGRVRARLRAAPGTRGYPYVYVRGERAVGAPARRPARGDRAARARRRSTSPASASR